MFSLSKPSLFPCSYRSLGGDRWKIFCEGHPISCRHLLRPRSFVARRYNVSTVRAQRWPYPPAWSSPSKGTRDARGCVKIVVGVKEGRRATSNEFMYVSFSHLVAFFSNQHCSRCYLDGHLIPKHCVLLPPLVIICCAGQPLVTAHLFIVRHVICASSNSSSFTLYLFGVS